MSQIRPSIRCSKCGSSDTTVTRTFRTNYSITRYRKCRDCRHNLKTIEVNIRHLPTGPELDFVYRK